MAHDNFPQGVSSARYSSSQLSPRAFLASVTSLVFVMYLQHEKVSNTFWNIILNKKPHVLVSWVWGYKLNNKVFDCFLSLFIVLFLVSLGAQFADTVCLTLSCQGLKVTMKKHPSAFKLCGQLAEKLTTVGEEALTLYEGHSWE